MINLSKKLYISIFALLLSIAVIGTTTFAWLKLNPNAFFDDMSISIDITGDLEISVDGEHYTNQLSRDDIKSAIVANAWNYKLKYVENEDKTHYYDFIDNNDGINYGKTISHDDLDNLMSYVKLGALTSNDGVNFADKAGGARKVTDGAYVQLDIYFQSKSEQNVYFSNREIKYKEYTIPKTELDIVDRATAKSELWNSVRSSFDTYDLVTGAKISYSSSLKNKEDLADYEAYASDAARFSIKTSVTNVETNEITANNKGIYEINKGRGSYATDMNENIYSGLSGASYDGTKNAALTYYNNYMLESQEDGGEHRTEALLTAPNYNNLPCYTTYKGLDTLEAAEILTLNRDNNYGAGGLAKMTMTIWLEGWDADCIDMVLSQELAIKMSFSNASIVVEDEPVNLTYEITNPETGEVIDNSKTRRQMIGLQITDDAPAYVVGNTTHKFLGWQRIVNGVADLEEDNATPKLWDFNTRVRPDADTDEARTWVLRSVWE